MRRPSSHSDASDELLVFNSSNTASPDWTFAKAFGAPKIVKRVIVPADEACLSVEGLLASSPINTSDLATFESTELMVSRSSLSLSS